MSFPSRDLGRPYVQPTEEILSLFKPVEGQVAFYYGRIRNGKTYAATADILELLKRGEIVYANWFVDFPGFDERESFRHVFIKTFFGRKDFFYYGPENFHYFHPDDVDVKFLGQLVGVHIFIDEGQWIFNSHDRNADPEKRKLILHNGHYCRSLNIISQRPTNVFKDMRSQVNVWYKCEKRLSWPLLIFEKTTYEDMKEDVPDEEKPTAHKVYVADPEVMRAYSTHAMRESDAIMELPVFKAWSTEPLDRVSLLATFFVPRKWREAKRSRLSALAATERPQPLPGGISGLVEAKNARLKPTKGKNKPLT